ncbi:pectinesterase inhibitor 10-like [Zingiber officinale]|uniref:pectinesterase inhibitor 10-like n=1 Tax=Zingiber officinale TaxID=94328 RepID=UPI001C4BAB9C|nr:pectinesterase inhibitor 10-like [Zingiber officinale]
MVRTCPRGRSVSTLVFSASVFIPAALISSPRTRRPLPPSSFPLLRRDAAADPFLLPPPSSRRSRRPLPPSSSYVATAVDPFLLPPPTSRQPPTPSSFIATAADPFLLHRDSRRSLPPPSLRQHPPTPYSPSSSLLLHRDSTRRGETSQTRKSRRAQS